MLAKLTNKNIYVCSPLTEKSEEAISRASIASSTVLSLSFSR